MFFQCRRLLFPASDQLPANNCCAQDRKHRTIASFEIKINNEEELYNSFDDDGLTLSTDIIDYLYSRYQEKGIRDKLRVRISSDEQIDMSRLKSAFRHYFDSELAQQLSRYGCLLSALASGRLPALPSEIISTIGAFSMWEAASIWIVENPNNRIKRMRLDILTRTEIVCDADNKQV